MRNSLLEFSKSLLNRISRDLLLDNDVLNANRETFVDQPIVN